MQTSVVHPDDGETTLAERLTVALEGREGQLAVTELLDACNRGVLVGERSTREWLTRSLPHRHFQKMIVALVRHPCMYCAGGMEECSNCNGDGIRDEAFCCRACAGFGRFRCDFCGGSGLASYNHFPADLRPDVLRGRTQLALNELERLSAHPLADLSEERERSVIGRILSINKLLAVLENARVETGWLIDHARTSAAAAPLSSQIDSAAPKALAAMQNATKALAALLRRQSAGARAHLAATRAEFYEQLFEDGGLAGSILHHPFIDRRPVTGSAG
jgi:hypothetical protein